jgi:hypothetical protein
MSAYVVQDRTINKIVAFLSERKDGLGSDAARAFKELGYNIVPNGDTLSKTADSEQKRLAKDLFEMNCRAVDQRYADHPAKTEFHPKPFKHEWEDAPPALEAIKRMGCLGYQCCEGHVPEEPLYKALREAQNAAALSYIYDLPEWDKLDCWE